MALATALSGRSISEDSLAISTAILAAPYAVCQPVSFSRTITPSLGVSWVSCGAEPREIATAVDVAASALGSLRDAKSFTSFVGGVGGVGVEISAGGFDLRKRRITKANGEINSRIFLVFGMIDSLASAFAAFCFDTCPRFESHS